MCGNDYAESKIRAERKEIRFEFTEYSRLQPRNKYKLRAQKKHALSPLSRQLVFVRTVSTFSLPLQILGILENKGLFLGLKDYGWLNTDVRISDKFSRGVHVLSSLRPVAQPCLCMEIFDYLQTAEASQKLANVIGWSICEKFFPRGAVVGAYVYSYVVTDCSVCYHAICTYKSL